MSKDDIRDLAILITEDLIDNASYLLSESVKEVNGEYTQDTFDLQDCIEDALTKNLQTSSR
jgi:hypothetical protein